MTKQTLTAADPRGFYLCDSDGRTFAMWWDGEWLRTREAGQDIHQASEYTNFRRLVEQRQAEALETLVAKGWIVDPSAISDDKDKAYIVFAIGQRPDKSTYVYNPQVMSGWEFKRLLAGCYAATPMPKWKP